MPASGARSPLGLRLPHSPAEAFHGPPAPTRRSPLPGEPGVFLRSPEVALGGLLSGWGWGGTGRDPTLGLWVPKASPRPAPAGTGCGPRGCCSPQAGARLPGRSPPRPGRASAVKPPPPLPPLPPGPRSRRCHGEGPLGGGVEVLPAGRGRAGRRAHRSARLALGGAVGARRCRFLLARRRDVTARRVRDGG